MNKKRLSVVMAGAMLASSVAPVLASTESTASAAELGMLVQKVRTQLTSKRFADETDADKTRNGIEAGKSVYYVKINGVTQTAIDNNTKAGDENALQNELQKAFSTLSAGATVEIWSKGFEEENEKAYANGLQKTYTADMLSKKYDVSGSVQEEIKDALTGENSATNKSLIDLDTTNIGKNLVYTPASGVNPAKITLTFEGNLGDSGAKTFVIKEGDSILDFTKYLDKTNTPNVLVTTNGSSTDHADIYGFAKKAEKDLSYTADYKEEKVETIKIEGGLNAYKTSDLYDGLMLTTVGHDVLSKIVEAEANTTNATDHSYTASNVKFEDASGKKISDAGYVLDKNTDGTYTFKVSVKDDKFTTGKFTTYRVTGDKEDTQTLLKWLYTQDPKVDLLAGDNRYETAVQIAKEQAKLATVPTTAANIVLVNGNSLVDGLSASPLAASLSNGSNNNAPILLTEADKLPKATKDYLKELLAGHTVGTLNTTIHLVGGTTVLSRSLEKELKSLGFTVVRHGGSNREETSMEVAEAIGSSKITDKVFVVGANGEADAMSIAPVASTKETGKVTPIIVSKNGGLSSDAIDSLTDKKVTVLGGEKAVSASDYAEIEEVTKDNGALRRIAGANRKETNAAIINEFYAGNFGNNAIGNSAKKVVIAKDDVLVDALTAANLAAQNNAPIVLATNSLSDGQINALELNAKTAKNLYQVGLGVNPSVVKTVAQRLGLVK